MPIMAAVSKAILDKLEHIQSDLDYIKEHILDSDLVLSEEDKLSIREAKEDLVLGKTKRIA
jgi:hypothetical protein